MPLGFFGPVKKRKRTSKKEKHPPPPQPASGSTYTRATSASRSRASSGVNAEELTTLDEGKQINPFQRFKSSGWALRPLLERAILRWANSLVLPVMYRWKTMLVMMVRMMSMAPVAWRSLGVHGIRSATESHTMIRPVKNRAPAHADEILLFVVVVSTMHARPANMRPPSASCQLGLGIKRPIAIMRTPIAKNPIRTFCSLVCLSIALLM